MNRKTISIFFILNFIFLGCLANTLEDAKLFYLNGQYSKALPIFKSEYKKKPKDPSLNHWLGVCYYETDSLQEAEKYLVYSDSRGILESPRYLAKIKARQYDFNQADTYFKHYQTLLQKEKKPLTPDATKESAEIKNAKSMLTHVEKIVIVDSILVNKNDFFKAYKISSDIGSLKMINEGEPTQSIAFVPQSGERMVWGEVDSLDRCVLKSKVKLIDGNWDTPKMLSQTLHGYGDFNYPFIMPDGVTLYYASNGEGSIGGYDIFVTRKDADTGDYLQPQNIGMPYNSPYDDYMFVLDEISGFGWWATDRNQIPDKVTIYVFIPNDIRQNYDPQDANIKSFARIDSYKSTWNGEDYTEYLEKIKDINNKANNKKNDFVFAIAPGIVYHYYKDFKSSSSASLMKELVMLKESFEKETLELKKLRSSYATEVSNNKTALRGQIISAENDIEVLRQDIFIKENVIRKNESRSN